MMRRNRRGVQALEFALAAPLLLAVGAGVIDYGFYFVQQQSLLDATEQSVRAAMDASLEEDPEEVAEARAEAALEAAGLAGEGIDVRAEVDGLSPQQTITVTLSMDFEHLVGMVPVPTHVENSLTAQLTYQ